MDENMGAGIKLSGRKMPWKDFQAASLEYCRKVVFGSANHSLERGIMLPPTCPKRVVGPTGDASGSFQRMKFIKAEKIQGKMDDFKGDQAMFKVWSAIEQIRHQVPNLICIAEFDFNQQLRTFLSKFGIQLKNVKGDYAADFLIVHREKGIFIVEVKSAEDYDAGFNHYLQGKGSSIPKMQNMEDGLNGILEIAGNIQMMIRKIVAFPNCIMKEKPDTFLRKYICLDASAVEDPIKWWDKISNAPNDTKIGFESVASMLIALRCRLQAIVEGKNCEIYELVNEKAHREAKMQSLDRQKFLEGNELFQNKHLPTEITKQLKTKLLVMGKPRETNVGGLGTVEFLGKIP